MNTPSADPKVTAVPSAQVETECPAAGASVLDSTLTYQGPLPFLSPPQSPDELGRFGPYRVLKKLGEGGMGAVLLAEEPSLSRKVALKVMRPELAANPSARERFFREAKSAAAIEHDHIIPIFAVSEANGVPFLAMPFLKGQPLDQRLHAAQGPLPLAEIAHIGREIASGLAAAHEHWLIHRDIKPGNIWLEDRGPDSPARVKILDFGLARSQAEDAHLTQSGAILGTPAYMAPEQALGHKVDERADLFSLGCVLYQLATGRRPFRGETTMAVLMSLGIDVPTAPQVLNPAIPQALSQLIMGLLVKDPTKRLASAAEVARKLRAIEMDLMPLVVPMAESVPAPTASDPWSGIDDGETPSTAPTIAPPQPNIPPRRELPAKRKGLLYGILGLLALAAGGFIIIKITNKDGTVTEVKVPDTAKIEVDGKTITPNPGPVVPATAWSPPKPIPIGESPFDKLDPKEIPLAVRVEGLTKELVAVIESQNEAEFAAPSWVAAPSLDSLNGLIMLPLVERGARYQLWDLTRALPKPSPGPGVVLDAPIGHALPLGRNQWLVGGRNGGQFQRFGISEGKWQPLSKPFGQPFWGLLQPDRVMLIVLNIDSVPDKTGALEGWDLTRDPPALKWDVKVRDVSLTPGWERWARCSKNRQWFTTASRIEDNSPEVILWRNSSPKPAISAIIPIQDGSTLSLSPDGGFLVYTSTTESAEPVILKLTSNPPTPAGTLPKTVGKTNWLAYSPDGRHIAAAGDKGVAVFDAKTLQPVWKWDTSPGPIHWLDWAADGRHLVTHNGNKTVYVLRLNQLAPIALGPQTDRQVAEWVLGVGGKVVVKENANWINDVKNLPAGEVTVTHIDLARSPIVDADLAPLAGRKTIEFLSLNGCPITDDGLRHVASLTSLKFLDLGGCLITDDGLRHVSRLTSLTDFGVHACKNLTSKAFGHLANLTKLGSLNLGANTKATDADIEPLLGLKEIESLTIHNCSFSSVGLARMRNAFPKLAKLQFYSIPLDDAAIAELVRMTKLQRLDLGGSGLVDRHLTELAKLPNLKEFGCHIDSLGEPGLKAIGRMSKLKNLGLDQMPLTTVGIAHLEALPLEYLALNQTDTVDDSFVPTLSRFKSLKVLSVIHTKFTEAGAKKLFAALPECAIHYPGGVIGPKK